MEGRVLSYCCLRIRHLEFGLHIYKHIDDLWLQQPVNWHWGLLHVATESRDMLSNGKHNGCIIVSEAEKAGSGRRESGQESQNITYFQGCIVDVAPRPISPALWSNCHHSHFQAVSGLLDTTTRFACSWPATKGPFYFSGQLLPENRVS